MQIQIYTDGACSGTPGRGGYSAIIIGDGFEHEISGGYETTTNNRMEIMGVLSALEYLDDMNRIGGSITIYSDSQYVVNSFNKWIDGWVVKGFAGKKNADLWRRVWKFKQLNTRIKLQWVKGHADNEYNNKCDVLAVAAKNRTDLPVDLICKQDYEQRELNTIY